jgi:hypothetical protein
VRMPKPTEGHSGPPFAVGAGELEVGALLSLELVDSLEMYTSGAPQPLNRGAISASQYANCARLVTTCISAMPRDVWHDSCARLILQSPFALATFEFASTSTLPFE